MRLNRRVLNGRQETWRRLGGEEKGEGGVGGGREGKRLRLE